VLQGKKRADLFFHDAKINVLFAGRNNIVLIMRKLWITLVFVDNYPP
jgi:hypothetical protein